MGMGQLEPQALVDYLLAVWARWDPETLTLEPISADTHALSIDLRDRVLFYTELAGSLGDAVVARLSLLGAIDFTAREERSADLCVRVGEKEAALHLSVRPAGGHLGAHLRRPIARNAAAIDREVGLVPSRVGEYTILGEMGRGGLGVVYRAQHRHLHHLAAVKLLTAFARASLSNAALVREARAAARTRHPGVVEIYDVVRLADGRFALIMELIEGDALSTQIARHGALMPAEALNVVRLIAEIMRDMHGMGIVHRDLKPENVFLLPGGGVKLLDFGAARPLGTDGGAATDSTFGTPWYMAPEQALGHNVDRRSDVYSLGCILYELLSGQMLFRARSANSAIAMHLSSPVPVPTSPHGPLPAALECLVLRSLAKMPQARQQDMGELMREIDAVLALLAVGGWRRWIHV